MTVVSLVLFVALAATSALLAYRQLVFFGFACALLSAVPLLLAANLPGAALAWVAVVGPIVALGVILDSSRNFT